MTLIKNDMKNMDIKKFISYFNFSQSIKEIELNKILDKISRKIKLSPEEKTFLGNYEQVIEDDIKNYKLLTPLSTFQKLQELISKNKKIICNIEDRNGKIDIQIKEVYSDYENESYFLILKNEQKVKLQDNFFYNILYILKKDYYSLESEEEFFEKISVKNED